MATIEGTPTQNIKSPERIIKIGRVLVAIFILILTVAALIVLLLKQIKLDYQMIFNLIDDYFL